MRDFIEYDRVLKTITQTYLDLDEASLNMLLEIIKYRFPVMINFEQKPDLYLEVLGTRFNRYFDTGKNGLVYNTMLSNSYFTGLSRLGMILKLSKRFRDRGSLFTLGTLTDLPYYYGQTMEYVIGISDTLFDSLTEPFFGFLPNQVRILKYPNDIVLELPSELVDLLPGVIGRLLTTIHGLDPYLVELYLPVILTSIRPRKKEHINDIINRILSSIFRYRFPKQSY